jgi:hypothetical protein
LADTSVLAARANFPCRQLGGPGQAHPSPLACSAILVI